MLGEFALARLTKRLRTTPVLTPHEAQKQFSKALFELMARRSTDRPRLTPLVNEALNATRAQLRATDDDLEHQIATIAESLDSWFANGDLPPPYPAWRIAVILSKTNRRREETAFLTLWCRHFGHVESPGFPALAERGQKLRVYYRN